MIENKRYKFEFLNFCQQKRKILHLSQCVIKLTYCLFPYEFKQGLGIKAEFRDKQYFVLIKLRLGGGGGGGG